MDMETDGGEGGAQLDEFVLREELRGHASEVRALCVTPLGELVTGGADAVVNRFDVSEPSPGAGSPQAAPVFDHSHSVTALLTLPPGVLEECPAGGFVSGCMDQMVRVFSSEGTLVRQLPGHSAGVISLSWLPSPDGVGPSKLVSGSWDGTARVWSVETGACDQVFPGHETGVVVLGLPNGDVVTGSTGVKIDGVAHNMQLRLWRDGQQVGSDKSHTGPVRGLSEVPGVGFLSASNDGTLRLRAHDLAELAVMAHPPNSLDRESYVYQGCALASGNEFVSSSEDATAVVWQDGTPKQAIAHPDTVWLSAALPNGDFATACHDGVVRLFTRSAARAAPQHAQQAYRDAIEQARQAKRQGPSAEEVAKLPPWEQRAMAQGRSEGDVKVFNKGGKAIAAQWSVASFDWIEVGEVTGSADGGQVDGVSFDHVFPIQLDQPGGAVLETKIGYNNGDNPYTTALQFIDKHQIDPNNLEQIADYIRRRASAATPTLGFDAAPTAGPTPAPAASSFSSGAAAAPPAAAAATPSALAAFCKFDSGLVSKMLAKLEEISGELAQSAAVEEQQCALVGGEPVHLRNLGHTLSTTNRWHASTVNDAEVAVLQRMLRWPTRCLFPVLDLARVALCHPDGQEKLARHGGGWCVDPSSPELAFLTSARAGGASMALQLTAARFACNAIAASAIRATLCSQPAGPTAFATAVLEMASDLAHGGSKANKAVSLAASSAVLNVVLLLAEAPAQLKPQLIHAVAPLAFSAVATGLLPEPSPVPEESAWRLLLAADTLCQLPGAAPPDGCDVSARVADFAAQQPASSQATALAQRIQKTLAA